MDIYSFNAKDITGQEVSLSVYKGKVLLIVNTASKCGYTPQYEGLQALYEKYKDQGLEILGFPCNQFLRQEPAGEEEIQSFCSLNFGVTFKMFSKIKVNGKDTHPLYQYLKKEATDNGKEKIKWNFTKFLISREGKIERYAPAVKPEDLEGRIIELL